MSYPSRLYLDYAFESLELDERHIQSIVKTLAGAGLLTPVLFCPFTPPDKNKYNMSPWYIHPWCKYNRPSAIQAINFRFYKYVLAVAIAVSYSNYLDIFERHIRDDTPILYDLVMLDKIYIERLQRVFTNEGDSWDSLWAPENGSYTVTEVLDSTWKKLNREEPGFSPSKKANTREPTEHNKQRLRSLRMFRVNRLMERASEFYIPAISAVLAFKNGLPAAAAAVLAFPKGLPDHLTDPKAMLVTEDANSIFHRNETIPAFVNGLINKILNEHREREIRREENEKRERRPPPPKVQRREEPPHREPSPLNSVLEKLRLGTGQLENRLYRERLQGDRERLEGMRSQRYPHGGKRTKRERKNRKRHTQRRK